MLSNIFKDSAIFLLAGLIASSSAFECPEKTGFFPHPEDCTAFYKCVKGEANLLACPEGLHFNADSIVCDIPSNVNCQVKGVTPDPALLGVSIIEPAPGYNCSENGAHPHDTLCEYFYECWEGAAILMVCTEQQLYDLRYRGCNTAELTGCEDRLRPPGYPGTRTPPPGSTTTARSTTTDPNHSTTTGEPDPGFDCSNLEDKAYPHPINCEKYYDCYQGVDTLFTCGGNYLFDLKYDGCNFPEQVDCGDRIRPPGYPGTSTPVPSSTPSTTRRPGAFTCPEVEGLFPDPEDCAAFYQCADWVDYHYDCPRPLLYNPNTVGCDHPINVDCGDRPRP